MKVIDVNCVLSHEAVQHPTTGRLVPPVRVHNSEGSAARVGHDDRRVLVRRSPASPLNNVALRRGRLRDLDTAGSNKRAELVVPRLGVGFHRTLGR